MTDTTSWARFATSDPEQAHEYIRAAYVDHDISMTVPDPAGFSLRTVGNQVEHVAVQRLFYSARTRVRMVPNRDLLLGQVLGGSYALGDRSADQVVSRGEALLVTPDRAMHSDFQSADLVLTVLSREMAEEAALAITGRDEPVVFHGPRPASRVLEQHWLRTTAYVHRTLFDPLLAGDALILGQTRRLLAATALRTFPNSTMDADPVSGGASEPAVVRRAAAFVEENAGRDVTLAEIAAAAGVGVRALQYAFRRHRGTTPLQHVRQVRLAGAHRDLQAGDPTLDTVAAIARRWGFPHAGRFSADYRAAYGLPPGRTLHR